MELDLKKLEQDIATLRKNRENVPLELLKTKYKKPYAKLKEEIRAQFEIYMKELSLLGILKIGPDMTPEEQKEMEAGIQKIIDEETAGGQDTRHTAHPHSTAARAPAGRAAQAPGRSTQSKRESVAATHAAHARHSGQGSEPRHRPCIR